MSVSTPNIIEAGRITVKTDGIAQILRRLTIYTSNTTQTQQTSVF